MTDFRFDIPTIQFSRDRKIDPPIVSSPEKVDNTVLKIEELNSAINSLNKVKTKAGVLLKSIEDGYLNTSIPVHEDNTEVRASVQRLLGGTDGSSIPFRLWIMLINNEYTRAEKFKIEEIAPRLTGETVTDSKVFLDVQNESPLWPYLAQLSVIFIANQLLGSFSGFDQAEKDATKIPPGTEVGPLLIQLLTSYAAFEAVQGIENFLNAKDRSEALKSKFGSGIGKSLLQDLEKRLKTTASDIVEDLQNVGYYESDRQIVMDYTSNYISNTADPSYEAWLRYPFIKNLENRSASGIEAMNLWTDPRGIKELSTEVPADIVRGFVCENEAANQALDRAAAALRSRYTKEAVCCFFRILTKIGVKIGKTDLSFIETIRRILRFYIMVNYAFGIRQILQSSLKQWHGILKNVFDRNATIVIRRFLFHFIQPVLDFLRRDEVDLLRFCTPFLEMTNIMLSASESLVDTARKLVLNFNADLQYNHDLTWELDMRLPLVQRARLLIRLLDALEDAIKSGLVCAPGNSGGGTDNFPEDMANIIGNETIQPQIQLPPPVGDPLVDFNDIKWETSGILTPFENGIVVAEDGSLVRIMRECMNKIPDEFIPEATELTRI